MEMAVGKRYGGREKLEGGEGSKAGLSHFYYMGLPTILLGGHPLEGSVRTRQTATPEDW